MLIAFIHIPENFCFWKDKSLSAKMAYFAI